LAAECAARQQLGEIAVAYLKSGDSQLALQLAAAVLARGDVQAALAVLRGGEFLGARATELAEMVLRAEQADDPTTSAARGRTRGGGR
jgi:hypothetical protein